MVRVRAAHLEVVEGPDAGRRVRIEHPQPFVVGSGTSADLRLNDTTVSREHVRLTIRESGLHIRDTGSTNGTLLGNVQLTEVVVGGDVALKLGATTIKLHLEAAPIDVPVSDRTSFGGAIGVSASMRHVFAILERAAAADVTVLLEGESGVGKEVLAQAIHQSSPRASGPFVVIDCGSIPPQLVESELFGHERGAFTGAATARVGAFEQADGGTIFLDEIGELPLDLQPKLLRFLETREVRPVGGNAVRPVNTRVVAATNRNLAEGARNNEFRLDLYYRLAVVRVTVPALRERREDILPLATLILRSSPGHENDDLPADFASLLLSSSWPGNVRELRNVIERYVVLGLQGADVERQTAQASTHDARPFGDLLALPFHDARRIAIERFEREYLHALLTRANNVVTHAADLGQLSRATLHRMLLRVRGASDVEDT
ncbi:MAG: sigma 54-dependent Fis family transcriptional regulator [Deltaproteobacteria bacterium]|nr:sigma 54-dependent Fis family transcriptional regulator [Deltaproteobacteria bacterium]